MNKVILMGRLVKDPAVRYSNKSGQSVAVAKYTIAVTRRFSRKKPKEADFIQCTVFGKPAEFAEKYFKKGQMISVIGRLQTGSFDDGAGKRQFTTSVIVEEQYFAESKSNAARPANQNNMQNASQNKPKQNNAPLQENNDGFFPIDPIEDDDLPF